MPWWLAKEFYTIKKSTKLSIVKDLFNQTCSSDISSIDGVSINKVLAENILRSYSRNICTLTDSKTIFKDATTTEISLKTFENYVDALRNLHIIDDVNAWCPAIRSKTAIRSSVKRNLCDPSLAVAALGINPEYFDRDFKTLGFLFESLVIRDLRVYSSVHNGRISYYRDRYGLEADCVLHLENGRLCIN